MSRPGLAVLLTSLLVTSMPVPPAGAAPTVIYRCVATDGTVTLQNGTACPKGTRGQKRVIEAPVAAPARLDRPPAGVVQALTALAPVRVADIPSTPIIAVPGPRLPPPPLQACLTRDAQRYYSDLDGGTRCTPLNAVGLDGRTPTDAQACEVVQDRCSPVPEGERCAAWAERRRVAEQALLFAPEQVDAARDELARVVAATAGTACAP